MIDDVKKPAEKSSRSLWLLIASFAVPMVAAYAYYFLSDDFSMGNNGKLITPMISIERLNLVTADEQLKTSEELLGKWRMLYVAGKNCDEICQEKLYHMRQVNKALGKYETRIKHMIIHTDTMSDEFNQLIEKEYPLALHAYTSEEILSKEFSNIDNALSSYSIFIMDPLGNIMMQYTSDITPKMMLKDLKHLLKISRIG